MWTLPSMQQGDALIGSDMADAGSGSSLLYGSIRLQHPWEIIPVLYFYKNTKEKMFRSKLLLKMLCPMRGVRVGSIALHLLLLHQMLQTILKSCRLLLGLFSSSLLETKVLNLQMKIG